MNDLVVKIKKQFNDFSLDIDFSTDNDTQAILGSSGCGKSMTLKCIAGIVTPDEGIISIGNHILFDSSKKINLKPQQRRIGYLFQNYALFPTMTVKQNILIGCSEKNNEEEYEQMINRFSIEELGSRYPSQLSGGQQQRVALARIFMSHPDVLLLDEPFSAIDSFLKEQLILEMIDLLNGFNGPKIMVTHNRDEAYKISDQTMVIDKGRVVINKQTADVFNHPEKLEVARLTGCKNFSPISWVDERHIFVKNWNVTLEVPENEHQSANYIGVRAHHFKPSEKDEINSIEVMFDKIVDDPFESNIFFNCATTSNILWWKVEKELIPKKMPDYIKVMPQNILLLNS